jgi:lipopolysaccharide cholinephosphotransferase
MNMALLVSTAILIIGTVFTIPYYLTTGSRLESGNVITLAVMCSWSVALLFLTRKDLSNTVYKFINYIVMLYMFTIIFFVGSRAVIIGFVIAYTLSFFIVGKKLYQKLFLIFIVAGIISFYFSLMVIDENMLKVDSTMTEEYREVSHSVFRLTSVEHWTYDMKLRMSIWKKAFSIGLENPILGAGASKYRSLYLSTPHNIFVSVFLTSGLLGIFTFIFLIVMCYSTFFSFYNLEYYPQITKFFFISFTTLLFVGATNDFSGGRYLLFFILISGISIAQKISYKDLKINGQS